jgi:hypothetical protein
MPSTLPEGTRSVIPVTCDGPSFDLDGLRNVCRVQTSKYEHFYPDGKLPNLYSITVEIRLRLELCEVMIQVDVWVEVGKERLGSSILRWMSCK